MFGRYVAPFGDPLLLLLLLLHGSSPPCVFLCKHDLITFSFMNNSVLSTSVQYRFVAHHGVQLTLLVQSQVSPIFVKCAPSRHTYAGTSHDECTPFPLVSQCLTVSSVHHTHCPCEQITLCLGILALLGIVGFRKARARGAAAGGGREAPRMTGVA